MIKKGCGQIISASKSKSKSTESCFFYFSFDILRVLHEFEHHKANLIKHDLGRLDTFLWTI